MVPTTNIDIFDAINQVNCPGKVTYTFCWDMNYLISRPHKKYFGQYTHLNMNINDIENISLLIGSKSLHFTYLRYLNRYLRFKWKQYYAYHLSKRGGVTLILVFSKENLNLSSFMHTGPGTQIYTFSSTMSVENDGTDILSFLLSNMYKRDEIYSK